MKTDKIIRRIIRCAREMHVILVTYGNERLDMNFDYGNAINQKNSPQLCEVSSILKNTFYDKKEIASTDIDYLFNHWDIIHSFANGFFFTGATGKNFKTLSISLGNYIQHLKNKTNEN